MDGAGKVDINEAGRRSVLESYPEDDFRYG